jgi:hypothetical protein
MDITVDLIYYCTWKIKILIIKKASRHFPYVSVPDSFLTGHYGRSNCNECVWFCSIRIFYPGILRLVVQIFTWGEYSSGERPLHTVNEKKSLLCCKVTSRLRLLSPDRRIISLMWRFSTDMTIMLVWSQRDKNPKMIYDSLIKMELKQHVTFFVIRWTWWR